MGQRRLESMKTLLLSDSNIASTDVVKRVILLINEELEFYSKRKVYQRKYYIEHYDHLREENRRYIEGKKNKGE